jgi:hypothetical protein
LPKIRAADFFSAMLCVMPELFFRLPQNVRAIFSGRNLLWHALAILLTFLIVLSGFDWTYFRWTRGEASPGSRARQLSSGHFCRSS